MSEIDKNIHQNTSNDISISLSCEIIETFENSGRTLAKIKFEPGLLELIIDPMKEYHLGDTLNVSGKLKIEEIDQTNSEIIK